MNKGLNKLTKIRQGKLILDSKCMNEIRRELNLNSEQKIYVRNKHERTHPNCELCGEDHIFYDVKVWIE